MTDKLKAVCVILSAMALYGCGESDFTRGKWASKNMAEYDCQGNLQVLAVNSDRIQYAILGQVKNEWSDLKIQFREDGNVVVKGRAGERFRFRDEGDGTIILEEAPSSVAASWEDLPLELVNCAGIVQD